MNPDLSSLLRLFSITSWKLLVSRCASECDGFTWYGMIARVILFSLLDSYCGSAPTALRYEVPQWYLVKPSPS
jgi:hypothetical protein